MRRQFVRRCAASLPIIKSRPLRNHIFSRERVFLGSNRIDWVQQGRQPFSAFADRVQDPNEEYKTINMIESEFASGELSSRKTALQRKNLKRVVDKMKDKRNSPIKEKQGNLFVTAINERATIMESIGFMCERQVGSLFVVTDECEIRGFLTAKDIVFSDVIKSVSQMKSTGVTDIMIPIQEVTFATQDQPLLKAASLMFSNSIRRLPVLREGKNDIENLNVSDVEHILSVKGLIWEMYSSLMASSPNAERESCPSESMSEETALVDLENNISEFLGVPTVHAVLKKKHPLILNTDVSDRISVMAAVEEMASNNCSYVVVRDQAQTLQKESREKEGPASNSKNELVGVLTERDILSNVLNLEKNPQDVLVKDVLSQRTIAGHEDIYGTICTVSSWTSLLTCMRLMAVNDHRHLPVMNKQNTKVIGIITSTDILDAISQVDFGESK